MARPRLPVALALGGLALVGLTRADPPHAPADPPGYRIPPARFVGDLSCSSAGCHGGGEFGREGHEYNTWVDVDPHFRAHDVLLNDQSRTIARLLNARRPNGDPLPAHDNELCLRCHAPSAGVEHLLSSGVGCESCHGPAERYLTAHYRADFQALSRREKAEGYGLYPTKDLAFRATLCASCHVGDAGREVNHDLIAAGHPRLAFEYTGYHHSRKHSARQGREWRHWQEKAYGPDFETRAWEIGQVASAKAAAELLRARADRAAVWPELSEYSCFACHKDLAGDRSWRQVTESPRPPGVLPWGTWYFSAADLAADDPPAVRKQIGALAGLMAVPNRNREAVVREAGILASRLDARLRELQAAADRDSRVRPYDGRRVAAGLAVIPRHALTANGQKFRDQDWDGAAQHYLAAAAHYYGWAEVDPGGRDPLPRLPLAALGRALPYPRGYNSPKGHDPTELLFLFRQLRTDTPDPSGLR